MLPTLPQCRPLPRFLTHLSWAAQEDQREFAKLVDTFKAQFNDGPRVQWGGHILGPKSQHKLKKRERAIAKELAQRTK